MMDLMSIAGNLAYQWHSLMADPINQIFAAMALFGLALAVIAWVADEASRR